MQVIKCDKCGKDNGEDVIIRVWHKKDKHNFWGTKYELCSECFNKLKNNLK